MSRFDGLTSIGSVVFGELIDALAERDDVPAYIIEQVLPEVAAQVWGNRAFVGWCADDVRYVAQSRRIELTDDQVGEVIERIEDTFDASCGSSWDDVESAVEYVVQTMEVIE